jgi:hypothetical protein
MRKSDKLKNFKKANLLAENRYFELKGLINENIAIDEISGEAKRSTFNDAFNKYHETPEWDVDSKSKYDSKAGLALSHINPEVGEKVREFAKKFNLNVSFDKGVGGPDNLPVFNIYFNDGQGAGEYNYTFRYNITPMEYNYEPFHRGIQKPQGFDRAMINLIKFIQSKELSFHSNLKEESPLSNSSEFDFKNNPEKLKSMIEDILQYFGTAKTGNAAIANDNKVIFITELLQMSPPSTFLRDGANEIPTNDSTAMDTFIGKFNR